MSELRMTVTTGESGPVIAMSGEADFTDADQMREVIAAQLASGAPYLTIDVAGLRFADSGAIGILTGTAKSLKQLGGGLILLHPQSHLLRVLEILGADQVLTILRPPGTAHEREGQAGQSTPPAWPAA